MVTADEEIQAKEFLKRAEIRTMKKDLMALRESDALRERDKIIKLRTLEEQLDEQKKKNDAVVVARVSTEKEKVDREKILQENAGQEKLAEKDLKNYVTEEEHQQIFVLESQKLDLERQIDTIDKEKEPALKLAKNELLIKKRDQQLKLSTILDGEKKLESEQKFIIEKEGTTNIPAEREGLEKSRWELDEKIKEVEKKRWVVEKEIQNIDIEIIKIDKSSESLVLEKNQLRDKVLGIDKSLREIYSVVIEREEEKRGGLAAEQVAKKEASEKARAEQNEKVQRQQWGELSTSVPKRPLQVPIPIPTKGRIARSFEAEEDARKKFMQDVEQGAQKGMPQQKSNIK